MNTSEKIGTVTLVGAGPGDPELLTLKAARLIQSADVVVYDNLVGPEILAMIPAATERIYVGKIAGNHTLPQDGINRLLVDLARSGKRIVRLKGGDPFVFGRGGEEMEELLAAGFEVDIVPGITAALGAAASCHFPLTHRDHAQSCVFITGHLKNDSIELDWPMLARGGQTLVFYMGINGLAIISSQLIAHGLPADTPAALIHKATQPEEHFVATTLANLEAAAVAENIRPPALIIVGSVLSLAEKRNTGCNSACRASEAMDAGG